MPPRKQEKTLYGPNLKMPLKRPRTSWDAGELLIAVLRIMMG
jgi:hypothetical protein